MNTRGILDEAFIGGAFNGTIDRRDIADQNLYNGGDDEQVEQSELAVFITAVIIYNKKGVLTYQDVQRAIQAQTFGDVRKLIDEFNPKRLESLSNPIL